MSYILYLETATKVCSVAVSENENLIAIKESAVANSHSSLITLYAQEVLNEAKIGFNDLSAVCVSMGPGSYTGLRIGVSTAKGFCYSLNIPLIAVNTLQSMANYFLSENKNKINENSLICPMIDARRMEVYSAFFNSKLHFVRETAADIIDEESYSEFLDKKEITFLGDGMQKCKNILSKNKNAMFDDTFNVSSKGMISIGCKKFQEKQFEDVAYFEPFYLKDFLATTPKKLL